MDVVNDNNSIGNFTSIDGDHSTNLDNYVQWIVNYNDVYNQGVTLLIKLVIQYLKERLSDGPFKVTKIFTFIARHLSVEFGYTQALHGTDLETYCRSLRQPQNGSQKNTAEILKACYF